VALVDIDGLGVLTKCSSSLVYPNISLLFISSPQC
jgi:hypothetical protein